MHIKRDQRGTEQRYGDTNRKHIATRQFIFRLFIFIFKRSIVLTRRRLLQ